MSLTFSIIVIAPNLTCFIDDITNNIISNITVIHRSVYLNVVFLCKEKISILAQWWNGGKRLFKKEVRHVESCE